MAPNMLASCCQSVTRCLPHQSPRVTWACAARPAKQRQMAKTLGPRAIVTDNLRGSGCRTAVSQRALGYRASAPWLRRRDPRGRTRGKPAWLRMWWRQRERFSVALIVTRFLFFQYAAAAFFNCVCVCVYIVFPHMAPNMLASCCQSVTRCLPHQSPRVTWACAARPAKQRQMAKTLGPRAIVTDNLRGSGCRTAVSQRALGYRASAPWLRRRDPRGRTRGKPAWLRMWWRQRERFSVALIVTKVSRDCPKCRICARFWKPGVCAGPLCSRGLWYS